MPNDNETIEGLRPLPRAGTPPPIEGLRPLKQNSDEFLAGSRPLSELQGRPLGPQSGDAFLEGARPLEEIAGLRPLGRSNSATDDEPFYSRAWDWLNKPLVDFNQTNEGGISGGVKDVASGLTTPLSIGLTIGTLGSGTALRALGIAGSELPAVVQGIRTMIGAGFTAQQAATAVHTSPRVLDALREGDYDTAKRLAVHVAAGIGGAALGAREVVPEARSFGERVSLIKPEEGFTPLKREVGKYLADRTANAQEAKLFEQNARAALPSKDKTTLGAISRYIEAGGSRDVLQERLNALSASNEVAQNYSAAQRDALLAKYERATNLTPEEKDFATKLRGQLSDNFELAHNHGVINSAVENYITHVWQDESNPAVNRTRAAASTGRFSTSVSMARARSFATSFEGEMLGRKLKTDDPIALTAHHTAQVKNAIAARSFLERLRDIKASDGRPMVAFAGAGTPLEDTTLINPQRVRSVRIPNSTVQDLTQSGRLADMLDAGQIVRLADKENKPFYAWNPADYRAVDHPAFHNWIFGANDTEGAPVYVKSEMRLHPESADYVTRAIGADKSAIRESAVGRAALKASSEAKGSLLAFSPFHVAQEGLRAVMTGVSPFGIEKWDLNADPLLRAGVEHGLTLGKDYRSLSDLTEGVGSNSKLIEKIPVLGRLQTSLHKFLFDDYIPSLKARAYRSLAERYRAANPTWPPDKILSEAAADTNARFGGINYKLLGRSLTSQDAARLTTLAPDWLESEVRFMARALNPAAEGSIARADLARIGAYTFAAARVLNMLESGKPHLEAPFGIIAKDKDGRDIEYSFRTPLTDLQHALSDPINFLTGRANPLTVRTGVELFTGRDDFGRRVTPSDEVADIAKNVSPIPVQTAAQRILGTRPNTTTPEQIAKSAGASVYQYRTEAEKLAAQLSSDRTATGPVDQGQLRRHQAKITAEDQIRAGQAPDLSVFSGRERREIVKGARLTPLQARFARLPMADALRVWEAATQAEKAQIVSELMRKKNDYVKRLSPDERGRDVTYRRLARMFPPKG